MASEYDNCPNCGVSFQGDPIPEDIAHHYSGTHWRRDIGIDGGWLGMYDGIVAIMCPDCKHEFPRGNAPLWQDMFKRYREVMDESQTNSEDSDI